jgi:DNA-binding beta-propeller fold protein YncE
MRRCKYRTGLTFLGAFLLGLLAAGCGGSNTAQVGVTVSPSTVTVIVNGTQLFTATVANASDTSVTWFVNDTKGGSSTLGTISTAGLYTAPATVPSSNTVTIKAVSNADSTASGTATVTLDSGVRVSISPSVATIGTGETLSFTATVTNDTQNKGVTWTVTLSGSSCTAATCGTLSPTSTASGVATTYTAPASPPSPATVTIKATSAADSSRSASASASIVAAADPTLTALHPTTAAQGSAFQDVYLVGTNLFSTSTVLVSGTPVPSTAVSSLLLRARIPDTLLATLIAPTTLDVKVQRQNGTPTAKQTLTVVPVRPALVGASPDSGTQGGGEFTFKVDGGYYGTSAPPPVFSVTAEIDGNGRAASVTSRQLSVTIAPGELTAPGLVSFAVRNSAITQPAAAPQQVAVANLAVQPCLAAAQTCAPVTPPSIMATLAAGSKPGAVAINTATGIAVVANHDSNDITLIALTAPAPGVCGAPITFPAICVASIPVGKGPSGVAVDNVRNLAVVANNSDNSISVVNLATLAVTTITTNIFTAPFSVGVNPLTGLAIVAYQSTNVATLIDLNTNTVVGAATANTGVAPQVAVEPRLNWGLITPGGAGSFTIVDLARQSSNVIAAAPNGAVRSSNVVSITTTTAHGLSVGQGVLVTGVGDSSFNGYFTVVSVPNATSFTYAQTAAPANSGGGSIFYASPLATFTVGIGVRGIGINPETEKAVLVDPTSASVSFLNVLNQAVTSNLTLESGAIAAAVNPLTDIGVTVNPLSNEASIIDPRTPARLAKIFLTGSGPKAVAVDPGSNLALVANETSGNVTVVSLGAIPPSLGAIRPLHVTQINPIRTFTSGTPLALTVTGKGFTSASVVRLDGTPLPTPTSVSDRQLTVTVPASLLGSPRRYALDVVTGTTHSNVVDFAVLQSVDLNLTNSGCSAPAPRAVAIDAEHNLAVVTNTGCNSISLIDLTAGAPTFGTVVNKLFVGKNPQGVAVISRLGKAVVTNRGDNTASLVDLVAQSVNPTAVAVGTEPIGVAINPDDATAVVANSGTNNVSIFSADTGGTATSASVDMRPVAVAIDPGRKLAAIAQATQNNLLLLDLSQSPPVITARIPIILPTGVVFDPVTTFFVVTASLSNSLFVVNPDTQVATPLLVGINPTSLAYNFQSSTLVTVNTASSTVSVIDFLAQPQRVRAVFGLTASPQSALDIHPQTNLAVIADQTNNRVLLVPLPR